MTCNHVPLANPLAQFLAHEPAIRTAIDRVLASGRYILGQEVSAFEEEFAAYLGAQHCIGVANGTDAVALALKGVGIRQGDEVITVSHTAVATVAAIEQIGAVPVFADIDPVSLCLDPAKVEALISPATKALVVVHIYGQPAPMAEILSVADQHGIKVIEDCAQAHGATIGGQKVGTFGHAAAFSYYPTKNLGGIGDGGAVVTNSISTAERCKQLREYGWKTRYISAIPGMNSRLDELQAAILRAKLPSLDQDNARRREIARLYGTAITDESITVPAQIPGTEHAMHLFVLTSANRNAIIEFLQLRGIDTALHYPAPVHLQPAYAGRIRGEACLPVTETLYPNILSLPMYPELTDEQVERVCYALAAWSSCSA